MNRIGFSESVPIQPDSIQLVENGQAWLYEFSQNGVIYQVVLPFSGLNRGLSARARDLLFLRSKHQARSICRWYARVTASSASSN